MNAQIVEFEKSVSIWEKMLSKIEANPPTQAQVDNPDIAGWFSNHIQQSIDKVNNWYFDNILELNHHQQQRVLDVGIQLTQIKNMIGNHGLGKPKKCRKCGLYKL